MSLHGMSDRLTLTHTHIYIYILILYAYTCTCTCTKHHSSVRQLASSKVAQVVVSKDSSDRESRRRKRGEYYMYIYSDRLKLRMSVWKKLHPTRYPKSPRSNILNFANFTDLPRICNEMAFLACQHFCYAEYLFDAPFCTHLA